MKLGDVPSGEGGGAFLSAAEPKRGNAARSRRFASHGCTGEMGGVCGLAGYGGRGGPGREDAAAG